MSREHTEAGWLPWSKEGKKGGDRSWKKAGEGIKILSKPEPLINQQFPYSHPMFTNKAL